MNKTQTDKKYYPMYLDLLEKIQQGLGIELDTSLDFHEEFVDKRVAFGYAIFVLERVRAEKLSKSIQEVADKGFEEMYKLGQESALQGGIL